MQASKAQTLHYTNSASTAGTGATVDQIFTATVQLSHVILKIGKVVVDIDGTSDMAAVEFIGSPDIEDDKVGIALILLNQIGSLTDVN